MSSFVMRAVVAVAVTIAALASLVAFAAPAAAETPPRAPSPVAYTAPVDAPVADPYRAPATPYGPGNRGIEYATAPGTAVAAAADGIVVFAGAVAGTQWVTIRPQDGVRPTYGPMASIGVVAGQTVLRGQAIGTTAGHLLFTARRGSDYIDPATLLASGPPHVFLVPESPDPVVAARNAIAEPPNIEPGILAKALAWERGRLIADTDLVLSATPVPIVRDSVVALVDWKAQRATCTPAELSPAVLMTRHVAVLVGGLGSTSDAAAVDRVDAASLGYAAGDVLRFSYAGGRTPAPGSVRPARELRNLEVTGYTAEDTLADLGVAGQRLAALLTQVADATPASTAVDVMAHSQGGIVTRVALNVLARDRPDVLARLGTVITLGTPHLGADLAGLARALDANPLDHELLEAIRAAGDIPLRADATAVAQLAPGSPLLQELGTRPPAGVRVVSIAARGDLVVPSPRTRVGRTPPVIVPLDGLHAHDELPGSAAATREMALALAGMGPTCQSAVDAVGATITGDIIHNGEHLLTAAA